MPAALSSCLDGIPINDPFAGYVLWSQVPSAFVESVLVNSGGGAGLFGNAALAGTIFLVSKPMAATSASAQGSIGNAETYEVSLEGTVAQRPFAARDLRGTLFDRRLPCDRAGAARPGGYQRERRVGSLRSSDRMAVRKKQLAPRSKAGISMRNAGTALSSRATKLAATISTLSSPKSFRRSKRSCGSAPTGKRENSAALSAR